MSFDIKLLTHHGDKINTIKALRYALNLGLREAKQMADNVPVYIARNVDYAELERIKEAFKGVAEISDTWVEGWAESGPQQVLKFNRTEVELPTVGPNWVSLTNLKLGEIVCTSVDLAAGIKEEDLRIVIEKGAINLRGTLVSTFSDGTFYQRLPKGTKITITIT